MKTKNLLDKELSHMSCCVRVFESYEMAIFRQPINPTTKIQFFPWLEANPSTKSIAISCHMVSRIGMGYNKLGG